MTLASTGQLIVPFPYSTAAFQSTTVDAASEIAAAIFQFPRTGNVVGYAWGTNTVTTGAILDCRLETVDASTGDPTGTLWGTNTNNPAFVLNNTDDNVTLDVTFTSPAAVTMGQTAAACIANPAAAFGTFQVARMNAITTMGFPYTDNSVSGVWTKSAAVPVLALKYDDGNYYLPLSCVIGTLTSQVSANTGAASDEIGVMFQLPFKARIVGLCPLLSNVADAQFSLRLYDAANNLLASSGTQDEDIRSSLGVEMYNYYYSAPYTLEANTNYRAVFLTSNTNNLTIRTMNFRDTTMRSLMTFGANFQYTGRKSAGAWTEVPTTIPMIGLVLDQIDYTGNVAYAFAG